MKKLRQILTFVVAFSMMFQCSLLSVFADDEYTYTVTFYAGNQGTFADGAGKIVMSNLKYGAFVSFDVQKDGVVTLNNSDKYYVKGLRKSGRDNSETDELEASRYSVTVKGDADYVVAYGIKGNQVAYTVNYQDANGKELLASNTYYGNVGDKPVVAYQYVEGYTPQALALTKTLSENSAENVFTFRYTPIGTTVVTIPGETTTVTTVVPGNNKCGNNYSTGYDIRRNNNRNRHNRNRYNWYGHNRYRNNRYRNNRYGHNGYRSWYNDRNRNRHRCRYND